MRLYAIPIVKNRWAYYCHSTIPSISRLTKAVDWSSQKWDALGQAKADSWKKKLHDRGTNVMNQLDYQEWFFKSVPGKSEMEQALDKVIIHHPSVLKGEVLDSELKDLLKKRVPYHKKYMYYSAYWVPVTCTFVIVPLVPNIPLAYNLFRLYSHYKAYKGAEHLQSLSDGGQLQFTPNEAIDGVLTNICFAAEQDIKFPNAIEQAFQQSPNKPDLLSLQQDIPGVLTESHIKQLVERLQVPGLEMELNRARFQILKDIATQRFRN
ncbi:mitochondrial K+-H+ exchange-related-domain-containing protein [Mucor mucedo]|uniref:mitochondrial K+-H+ exchange-related-domain-containing protein n=1 Tax=Mucor mucedo TaxID=29922 RepID=UPI00221F0EDB|nr:mitochondrial K+-H+ exchange-related-domain-containing protein [Mucor mucedo]KAI7887597.1 mitochondrial K+-H+ exchange-related-domain-containing protein [Mucor mucedo]